MEEETKPKINCPICGGQEFDNGIFPCREFSHFRKDGAGMLTRYPIIGEKTYAKRCIRCRFVAIFTE